MAKIMEYLPGGFSYQYISDIEGDSRVNLSDTSIEILKSQDKDVSYPAHYCNQICFGGYEIAFDSYLSYKNPGVVMGTVEGILLGSPLTFNESKMNLAEPMQQLYSSASKFTSGSEFGQDVGETHPAKVMITPIDTGGCSITWYDDGTLVSTDTLSNNITTFAIAVVLSGNTITGYAYIYYYGSEIWTSGLKSDADVLNILNSGGAQAETETVYYWNTDKGEFVFSLIYSESGTDAYSGVAARDTSGTLNINTTNAILLDNCERYNGYLGTDIVPFLAETETNAEGWTFLLSAEGDGANADITATDGHTYNIGFYHNYEYAPGQYHPYSFVIKKDGVLLDYILTNNALYRVAGCSVYITWYEQSSGFENKTRLVWCYTRSNPQGYFYQFTAAQGALNSIDYESMSNIDAANDAIDGYDGEGQKDEPQEEPDDIEDAAYDPLASGFLYAFMVTNTDMENLAAALVPDTLAQKLRADFGNNLFEFIVSYHMMPCLTNADTLNKTNILYRGTPFVYGPDDTQLALAPITKTWYNISCGTKMCVPTGIRNTGFENWAHANIQLYLPFIGYVHLNTADVWNKAISISYRFDILQGTCVANIGVGSQGTMYSYEGICKYAIPFTTAIDKSNQALLSGIFSSAGAAVSIGGVIAGGSPTALVGAAGGIADAAGSFISAAEHKSVINRGGCLSGSPGWNMPRKPALFITVPNVVDRGMFAETYNNINGYPCCRSAFLTNYGGSYVEVGQIDLKAMQNTDNAAPNDSELSLINSTLKGGVYV